MKNARECLRVYGTARKSEWLGLGVRRGKVGRGGWAPGSQEHCMGLCKAQRTPPHLGGLPGLLGAEAAGLSSQLRVGIRVGII